jgi:hypothetical protein
LFSGVFLDAERFPSLQPKTSAHLLKAMYKTSSLLGSAVLTLSVLLPCASAKAEEGELSMVSPIPFKGVAKLVTQRHKDKNSDVRAVYPQFSQNTMVTRFANWKLRVASQTRYRDFLGKVKKDIAEDFQPLAPYGYDELPELHYYHAPRLISTAFAYYSYTGGAHGMSATITTNYGQFAGMSRPKILTLGDFFTGKGYRKPVEKKLLDTLRGKKDQVASWVQDGTVKTLTDQQLNNFTVSPKGLTWYFAPYEVGPYAAGPFEVQLKFNDLPTDFKRSVVLGR